MDADGWLAADRGAVVLILYTSVWPWCMFESMMLQAAAVQVSF